MAKNSLECFTKIFELKPHDLVIPDKCSLAQVRNAMNMNDNIRKNYIDMVLAQVGGKVAIVLAVGIVFACVEPGIVGIINAVKSKDKEVKEDKNNKEEE